MKIHYFWSSKDFARSSSVRLHPLHLISIESCIRLGYEVHLYSYQNVENLPDDIVFHSAEHFFSRSDAISAIGGGHRISHLSNLVRLIAANDVGGLVMDLDSIVLRRIPEAYSFVATIPAKRTGGMAKKWGPSSPPLLIRDGSWDGKALVNFPLFLKSPLPYVDDIIKSVKNYFLGEPNKGINQCMWQLRKLPLVSSSLKVFSPIMMGPVPPWCRGKHCYSLESPSRFDGVTELFGYRLPSIDEILRKSFIVQHWFESVNCGNEDGMCFDESPLDGSLLASEIEFIRR